MKKLLLAAAMFVGLSGIAYACTTYTIVNADGTIRVCTICANVVTCM